MKTNETTDKYMYLRERGKLNVFRVISKPIPSPLTHDLYYKGVDKHGLDITLTQAQVQRLTEITEERFYEYARF